MMKPNRSPRAYHSLAAAAVVIASIQFLPASSRGEGWGPGDSLKQSMIRLLASASVIVQNSDYGFMETAYLGAFLQPGSFSFLTMTLSEDEEYAFLGAGNQKNMDLDIVVEDEQGNSVVHDVKDNDAPVVIFSPPRTGRYHLKLKLFRSKNACFCGMVLLKKNGWNVPVKNLDVAMNNMLRQSELIASQRPTKFADVPGEWSVVGVIIKPGESAGFQDIQLGTGRRAFTSGGDTVCRDIDLAAFEDGASRKILDADLDGDATPLVQFDAFAAKRYSMIVKNVNSNGGCLIMTALLEIE